MYMYIYIYIYRYILPSDRVTLTYSSYSAQTRALKEKKFRSNSELLQLTGMYKHERQQRHREQEREVVAHVEKSGQNLSFETSFTSQRDS